MAPAKCWRRHPRRTSSFNRCAPSAVLKGKLCCLIALFFLVSNPAVVLGEQTPIAGRDTLRLFLNEVSNYTARFEQALYDEYGELLEESSGTVILAKPGKFRWEYLEPYSQQIISNGELLWIYDEDLLQVSISKIAQGDEQSPLALLVNGADIEKSYLVEALPRDDELRWLRLTPKLADSEYQRVEIGVTDVDVVRMRLHDNLNQVTDLSFIDADKETQVNAAIFEFIIPAGVDVVNGLTE